MRFCHIPEIQRSISARVLRPGHGDVLQKLLELSEHCAVRTDSYNSCVFWNFLVSNERYCFDQNAMWQRAERIESILSFQGGKCVA